MSKAKKRPMLDSDSDESDSDSEETSQAKKSKLNTSSTTATVTTTHSSSSGTSSDEDDEWTFDGGKGPKGSKKQSRKRGMLPGSRKSGTGKKQAKLSSDSNDSDDSSQPGNQTDSITSDSSSSDSSGSDDDSESSSGSTDESEKFDDGLDDDLVGDEEDRQKLASMTEAEREQELFKRHEQREVLTARLQIQKTLKKQQQKMKKKKKDHDSKSRTLRAKEPRQTKTTRAIDELKAKRTAAKQKKAERKNADDAELVGKKQPLQVSSVFSSDEDDDDDDDDYDDNDNRGSSTLSSLMAEGSKFVTTLDQLSRIKLSRFRLEKWVHMPFFEKIVIGCYVRIGIGQHEGRMVYRICEIVKAQETPKVYSLGTARTNKGLKLRFGTQERLFRMEYISNSPFTDVEFSKWKAEHESHGLPFPTMRFVEKKTTEIEETKNVNLKEEDIDKIITEKQKFRKNPHNYAMAKNRMMREKEIAEQLGDGEKAAALTEQLSQLEERAEELDRRRSKGLSAITYINERNRQRNVERAEEALKEEMANIRDKEEDPFTRRKCMPRLVTFGKDGGGTVELAGDQTKDSSGERKEIPEQSTKDELDHTPLNSSRLLPSSSSSTPAVPSSSTDPTSNRVDDLFSAHDFDISIDLSTATQGPDLVKATPKQVTTPKNDGPKRSLNLSDYKKRRGLI